MGQALLRHDLDCLVCQAGTDTTTSFLFPKACICICFFHGAWTFELSSTNPLWLCLSWSFSNQCPQLAWGPEDRGPPSRRNEIYQIDPSWIKPKSVKHLLTGLFFPLFGFWSSSGLGRAEWRVYGVQFADGITEKLPMARGHKMSQVFRSIVYLVKGFQGCWSRLIVKLSHRLCWIHDYSWSFFRHIEKLQWILMNFDCWNILDS